jgi:hypothetical protein
MAKDKLVFGNALGGFSARASSLRLSPTPVSGPSGFSAFIYQCWLNVDWDGAHTCYGLDRPDTRTQRFPLQKNLQPWERPDFHRGSLNNARVGGKPSNPWSSIVVKTQAEALNLLAQFFPGWSGLDTAARQNILSQFWDNRTQTAFGSLEDVAGNGKFPIVQLAEMGQPAKGYYVSTSHAFVGSYSYAREWDQNMYWDAAIVPYSVVPRLPGVRLGDFGLVIRNKTGDSTPFFFADTSGGKGGSRKLGECSGFVYLALGESEDEPYSFIVFPRSGSGSADGDALGRMDTVVTAQLAKIVNTGNALAERLAPRDPQLLNVRRALFENGGPPPAYDKELSRYPREHGGPGTRDEDFPEGYPY